MRLIRWTRRNPLGTALILTLILGLAVASMLLVIAHHERVKNQLIHANLVAGFASDIENIWGKPEPRYVKIKSEWLAVLTHQGPREPQPTALRLSLGLAINDDPIGRAIHYAALLDLLEERMGPQLGQPVCLDLMLYKPGRVRTMALAEGEVDLQRSDALGYLRAKELTPGIQPVVRQMDNKEAVIFARKDAGITNLSVDVDLS